MFQSRHFTIMALCLIFIALLFWWQQPEKAVSAMANTSYSVDAYSLVKNYFNKIDYRQFDLAADMIAPSARKESLELERTLKHNPFLSIQTIDVKRLNEEEFLVSLVLGTTRKEKRFLNYELMVSRTEEGYLITSLKPSIP